MIFDIDRADALLKRFGLPDCKTQAEVALFGHMWQSALGLGLMTLERHLNVPGQDNGRRWRTIDGQRTALMKVGERLADLERLAADAQTA